MNSRKPKFDDDLGQLIRKSLQSRTDQSEPSPEIWEQIKERLETVEVAPSPPPRRRIPLPPPVIQAVFIMLLIVLGGIGLRPERITEKALPISPATLADPASTRFIDEYTTSPGVELPADRSQLQLLKCYLLTANHSRVVRQIDPALVGTSAFDPMPHPLSPAGRLVYNQIAKAEGDRMANLPLELEPIKDVTLTAAGLRLIR
jgi:hypothetical protein